jgi:hypothetical protein
MEETVYLRRVVDDELDDLLLGVAAVALEGRRDGGFPKRELSYSESIQGA